MLPYRDSRITTIAIVVFFVLVLGYAYLKRAIALRSRITVSSGTTEVHDPFIQIKGTADRISSLSMNGKQINVTEGGVFDEPYLPPPD